MPAPRPASPKERPRRLRDRFSYGEDANEAPKLVEDEPVDIEADAPSEDRPSVEGAAQPPGRGTAAFEE
jgi:hypothetical protein